MSIYHGYKHAFFFYKNKDNKELKKEFETWKKQAKEKITKLKHGELTEDEVYEWLQKKSLNVP